MFYVYNNNISGSAASSTALTARSRVVLDSATKGCDCIIIIGTMLGVVIRSHVR